MSKPQNSPPSESSKLEAIRRHPVATAVVAVVAFLVWSLPIGIAQAWPAFVRDKTIPEWLAERRWPGMTAQVYFGLTIGFFLTLVVLLVVLIITSRRKESAAPFEGVTPSESEELKRLRADLERAEESARSHNYRANAKEGELKDLKNEFGWLFEFANWDKTNISRYVIVKDPSVSYEGLSADYPYIAIKFFIVNTSVYRIRIDEDAISGSIYRKDEKFSRKPTIDEPIVNVSRFEEGRVLTIKQHLDPEEHDIILNTLLDIELKFDELKVMVKAGDESLKIMPQRLRLPSSIPIKETQPPNLRVAELKDRIKELEQTISQLRDQLNAANLQRRQQYLDEWRRMVVEVTRKFRSGDRPHFESFTEILERQPGYVSLKPHLSSETLRELNHEKHDGGWRLRQGTLPPVTQSPFGNHYDPLVAMLIDDIARKAKEWGLD
jgi:hypothetical protein